MDSLIALINSPLGYILLGLLVVLFVLSLLKKLIKLAIILILVALVVMGGKANISGIKEQYQFKDTGTTIEFVINKTPYTIPKATLKEVSAVVTFISFKETNVTLATTKPISITVNRVTYELVIKPMLTKWEVNLKEVKG